MHWSFEIGHWDFFSSIHWSFEIGHWDLNQHGHSERC